MFNNLDVDSYHQFEISKSRILKYKINHKNTNNADIFIKDNNINKLNNLILDGSYSNTATKSIYDIDNLKFKNNFDNFTFKNIILQKTEDLKILNLYAEKIDVKGKKQHPVYTWLTSATENPHTKGNIKWNFTKFLIDKNGRVVKRFGSMAKPLSKPMISAIEAELKVQPRK